MRLRTGFSGSDAGRRGRLIGALVAVLVCSVVAVGGAAPALAGTDNSPCPYNVASTTPVRGTSLVLVCQSGKFPLSGLESKYMPPIDLGRINCPRDYYVRDSRSGSPYAQWDYSAGSTYHSELHPGPTTGESGWVSWGGILRAWEANGRWTGGVAPLVTNWSLVAKSVQVFFYCERGSASGTLTRDPFASPFARSAETPLLEREQGSPPPADAGSAPESPRGVVAPPPAPEPIVKTIETLASQHHVERAGRGPERLIDDGAGTDALIGGTGDQTLIAGFGNDTLRAGHGTQTLIGGPGNDTLIGGTGQDGLFTAGAGNRIIAGRGPSLIDALGQGDSVDCRNHRATVVAIRSVKVKGCRNVHRVKQPAWARKPPWVKLR